MSLFYNQIICKDEKTMIKTFEEIFNYVKDLEIIDTHEHLPCCESAREKNTDVLKEYLTHYFSQDLISAGLGINDYQRAINNKISLMSRWKLVEPYWEIVRNTGYGRTLDISAKALYGVEKICRSTIKQLNEAFLKSLKPGHFRKVLKEKSKIKVSLLVQDQSLECDKSFFRSLYYVDNFISPKTNVDITRIEEETGIKICCLDDWLKAYEIMLDKALNLGAVALKTGLAYEGTLKYERVSKDEAENAFNEIFKVKHVPDWARPVFTIDKKFQDYMMHFILNLANKRNLTFQFHTGMHGGSGNIIYNSDPSLLSNLFLEYPNVDFDILHIGYPYQQVLSVLAKTFPNVYIDMTWAHIISPTASINALAEWIDSVPINKISAFGGDSEEVDLVYGHQYLARVNVSKSLAKKVEEGVIGIEKAKEISEMLFYKNPLRIFKLEGKI